MSALGFALRAQLEPKVRLLNQESSTRLVSLQPLHDDVRAAQVSVTTLFGEPDATDQQPPQVPAAHEDEEPARRPTSMHPSAKNSSRPIAVSDPTPSARCLFGALSLFGTRCMLGYCGESTRIRARWRCRQEC